MFGFLVVKVGVFIVFKLSRLFVLIMMYMIFE